MRSPLLSPLLLALFCAPLAASPLVTLPGYLQQLPAQAYGELRRSFDDFYQATDFTPAITNSYFSDSELYDFVGVPLAITARNGFQLELFTQAYSLSNQSYLHLNQDQSLYGILRADLMGRQKDQLAAGVGIGIPLTASLSLRAIASTHELPGYGSSRYAIGMEWHF
ncbi:hypothetical protein [Aeromonas schubertii]|uniref:Uncharacterized protein n=1 Tax=Aeromonas schubertii TaxID=652 RepID=A0A0S2SDP0_9GAMM|nr:hypothetical protein [Aeromonas schubertii]ALP39816.1 hypothetical protein WL1483_397 [Aeromonas schubertii]KUE79000.1 hypothetical protein ATO46_06735 [Aeromonas schubertii]MBZ6065756.1 hypothetical protein [Aeromonas schubertii]MBZ6072079.1 hypothetical protein [Aeromonas schubertii]